MKRALLAGCAVLGTVFALTTGTASKSVPFPNPEIDDALAASITPRTIVVAGGCFWGVEAVYRHVKGVVSATSGYSGGTVKNPSYEAVCTGRTGHAESVQVVYDASQITLGQILKTFFSVA